MANNKITKSRIPNHAKAALNILRIYPHVLLTNVYCGKRSTYEPPSAVLIHTITTRVIFERIISLAFDHTTSIPRIRITRGSCNGKKSNDLSSDFSIALFLYPSSSHRLFSRSLCWNHIKTFWYKSCMSVVFLISIFLVYKFPRTCILVSICCFYT